MRIHSAIHVTSLHCPPHQLVHPYFQNICNCEEYNISPCIREVIRTACTVDSDAVKDL